MKRMEKSKIEKLLNDKKNMEHIENIILDKRKKGMSFTEIGKEMIKQQDKILDNMTREKNE
jgi:spore germination protein YaaH